MKGERAEVRWRRQGSGRDEARRRSRDEGPMLKVEEDGHGGCG